MICAQPAARKEPPAPTADGLVAAPNRYAYRSMSAGRPVSRSRGMMAPVSAPAFPAGSAGDRPAPRSGPDLRGRRRAVRSLAVNPSASGGGRRRDDAVVGLFVTTSSTVRYWFHLYPVLLCLIALVAVKVVRRFGASSARADIAGASVFLVAFMVSSDQSLASAASGKS